MKKKVLIVYNKKNLEFNPNDIIQLSMHLVEYKAFENMKNKNEILEYKVILDTTEQKYFYNKLLEKNCEEWVNENINYIKYNNNIIIKNKEINELIISKEKYELLPNEYKQKKDKGIKDFRDKIKKIKQMFYIERNKSMKQIMDTGIDITDYAGEKYLLVNKRPNKKNTNNNYKYIEVEEAEILKDVIDILKFKS